MHATMAPSSEQQQTTQALELVIQKADIEGRIVDDEFGTPYKSEELVRNTGKKWLVGQKGIAEAMDTLSVGIHFALRIEVIVEAAPGQAPVHHLQTTDLDQAMALRGINSRRFSIENNLSHIFAS